MRGQRLELGHVAAPGRRDGPGGRGHWSCPCPAQRHGQQHQHQHQRAARGHVCFRKDRKVRGGRQGVRVQAVGRRGSQTMMWGLTQLHSCSLVSVRAGDQVSTLRLLPGISVLPGVSDFSLLFWISARCSVCVSELPAPSEV